MKRILIKAILFWVTIGAAQTFAQETRGAIYGTVTDPYSAVVPNAIVTATQQNTNLKFTATTNADGDYRLLLLPVGSYSIRINYAGFVDYRNELTLQVGEQRRVDGTLGLSVDSNSVYIELPITESATATQSTVIPAERVENLPLNGRQIQELALTAPGVSASGGFRSSAFNQFGLATPADGNGGAFSVNGAGSRSNGFFLDGADINVPEQGVIAFPPPVEAVREFQIQTNNFAAEYGRYSGSIVNFVTKSGTNDFRGNVYEFFRNDAFDANDPFNKAAGLEKPILRQNQFGATGGGAIIKNRLFVFGNYEGNYVRQGSGAFTSNLPTAEQRQGILRNAAGNVVNVAVNPISAAILNRYIPLPNANSAGANYIANGIEKMNEDIYTVRGDAHFTNQDLLTARYTFDNQRQFYPFDIFFVSASLPAFSFPNPEKRTSFVGSYIKTFTPNLINEFRFGFNYQENPIPNGDTADPASFGLPNGAPQNEYGRGVPVIRITGFGGTGGQPFTDDLGASFTNRQVFQFVDNVTLVRGAHTFKTGIELRRARINSNAFRTLRGSLNFNGSRNNLGLSGATSALADFLLGLPAQAAISSADPNRIFETKTLDAFFQDEWRVSERLNLSLGLRYEIDTPLVDTGNRLASLIPGVGNFVVGSPELPRLHKLDKNNFAPRVGAAYSLTKDGKTVVRGGGGIFYDNGVLQDRFGTARTNAPFAITNIDNNPAPFPTTGSATTFTRLLGSGAATGAASIATDFRTPYALQYNVSFQREIYANTLAEIAYVGRRGLNLSRQVNINQIVAANSPQAQFSPVGSRPFAGTNTPAAARFANDIVQQQSSARSNYNSLQIKVERRFSKGTSFLLAYTFSKSLDDASGIGTGSDDRPQDSYNTKAQRAVSNFDIPHRFVFSATYALPFGKNQKFFSDAPKAFRYLISDFQLNTITTLQSGQPFTVTVGSFDALTGISNRRPNLIGDPFQNAPAGFAFNPTAFAAPPAGLLGNAGRNIIRGGKYYNADVAVLRNFALPFLGEGKNLQFRAEFFNIFNNVNFTAPVTSLSSAAFGFGFERVADPIEE
ncbi:MAG: carboxypeptidase regulatory-like domain-containing protein, partial [Acidobacteriota bacterium]|nr:carboxypeptidase regulatory-like domain-containing protein [Acidobacteriota bacterium]